MNDSQSIWGKLLTALRGKSTEIGEAIVDTLFKDGDDGRIDWLRAAFDASQAWTAPSVRQWISQESIVPRRTGLPAGARSSSHFIFGPGNIGSIGRPVSATSTKKKDPPHRMERAISRAQSAADMRNSILGQPARTGPPKATRFLRLHLIRDQVPPSRQMPRTQPFTASPLPESCILAL
mgnify:CR=1 FL=1